VIIITRPWKSLYPEELYQRGLRAIVASTRAKPPESLPPSIKSLNYLANIMAKIEANIGGVDEAIMLDVRGFVAEGTAENIFIVQNGILLTPPVATNLPGITRETIIELAQKEGYEVREEYFGAASLCMADECFVTGTAAEIAPVVEIDGRKIGEGKPGPITTLLRRKFKELTGKPETGTPIYFERQRETSSAYKR